MSGGVVDRDLAQRLEALLGGPGDSVRVEEVAAVVEALLGSLSGDISAADRALYRELQALAHYIEAAKAEIASLRPQDIQGQYIAVATDELDAIVEATETATNSILDAAEKIEGLLPAVPPGIADQLSVVTTQIYESCNFQDITGQRITKVVKTLKHIEETIEALVAAFGPGVARAEEQNTATQAPPCDEDLLNGPQLPGKASRQDEIDALLASFD